MISKLQLADALEKAASHIEALEEENLKLSSTQTRVSQEQLAQEIQSLANKIALATDQSSDSIREQLAETPPVMRAAIDALIEKTADQSLEIGYTSDKMTKEGSDQESPEDAFNRRIRDLASKI